MAKPLKHSAASLVAAARAQIEEIDSQAGQALLDATTFSSSIFATCGSGSATVSFPGASIAPEACWNFGWIPIAPTSKSLGKTKPLFPLHLRLAFRYFHAARAAHGAKKVAHLATALRAGKPRAGHLNASGLSAAVKRT